MGKGWIKLHRAIIESDIYIMPPLYLRVFERLLIEANHQDNEIPFKYFGSDITTKKLIKRGEKLTSIRTICEWVGWYENGIFKKPNPKTVKEILDWLVANEMITIFENQSNRDGTHYNIVNYNDYQSKDGDEVTVDKQSVNSKETVTGSKQECIKNVKNVKEEIHTVFFETYNSQNIISHKELTSKMKQAIGRALKKDSEANILEAIERYGQAFKDPNYQFCKYKMTLDKFLTQNNGYYDWLDEGQKWINYSDFKNKGPSETQLPSNQAQAPKHKTKFHLANSRGDKYSADELEQLILNNQKKKLQQN